MSARIIFEKIQKHRWKILLIVLICFGLFIRAWRLSAPHELVFDEIYYAQFAKDYLEGTIFYDVHPPLGKLLIALGIKLLGWNSLGWRFSVLIFGTALIPLVYAISQRIFRNRLISFAASFLITIDGLFIVQSRTALLSSFLVLFVLSAILFYLYFLERKTVFWLILSGLFFALAWSVQWTAIIIWLVCIYIIYAQNRNDVKMLWKLFLFFVLLPLIIYCSFFLFNNFHEQGSFWRYLIFWHNKSLSFHLNLTQTHPYQSRWYTWLYLYRPVWYYFKSSQDVVEGIVALGNPLLWWSTILTIPLSIWWLIKYKQKELFLPLIIFLVYYLFWIAAKRPQFQYYILPVMPFLFMLTAYFWVKLQQFNKKIAYFWFLLIVANFVFFYPLLTAWPISEAFYRLHIWLPSWI